MHNLKIISKRTLAYIVLKITGTLGGGFVMGIEVLQAVAMAAFIGAVEVAEEISRAYVEDGNVSEADVDEIFGAFAEDHDDQDDEI